MDILFRIIALIIGYIFGLFNTGKFIAKKTGHDLNKEGSGNPGATNAFRVLGFKVGLMTFLGDALKAIIPILIFRIVFKQNEVLHFVMPLYAGLGAFIGHIFPIYNKFKGGKGVSTCCGFVWGTNVLLSPIPLAAFAAIAVGTGYVVIASCTAFVLVAIQGAVYGIIKFNATNNFMYIEFLIIYLIIPIIGIYKHKENIIRLKNGTENRFGHHNK